MIRLQKELKCSSMYKLILQSEKYKLDQNSPIGKITFKKIKHIVF